MCADTRIRASWAKLLIQQLKIYTPEIPCITVGYKLQQFSKVLPSADKNKETNTFELIIVKTLDKKIKTNHSNATTV